MITETLASRAIRRSISYFEIVELAVADPRKKAEELEADESISDFGSVVIESLDQRGGEVIDAWGKFDGSDFRIRIVKA